MAAASSYRINKVSIVSGSTNLGKGTSYPNVWGIMKGQNNASGSLNLAGGGSISFQDIDQHQIIPCYALSVTVNSGTIMILE